MTGSLDKTIRVWSLADGSLVRTIRMPAGPGNVGKVYAVAISPDGTLIAAGGWTRWTDNDQQEQIYLFDRESGALKQRIEGLPSIREPPRLLARRQRLAAVLGDGGLRVYASQTGWAETARDEDIRRSLPMAPTSRPTDAWPLRRSTARSGSTRAIFGPRSGRTASCRRRAGERPYGIAFSPDGARLAVGNDVVPAIGRSAGCAHARATAAAGHWTTSGSGVLNNVAWSRDGATLFAAGGYQTAGKVPVLAWAEGGAGARRILPAGLNTAMSLMPLPGGDLLVASQTPGSPGWRRTARCAGGTRRRRRISQASSTFCRSRLTAPASASASRPFGKSPARFDLATRTPIRGLAHRRTNWQIPRQTGLPVEIWAATYDHPTLGGKPLPLAPYETSRSLAIHPNGDRFVLGTEWSLRAFDAQGTPLWTRAAPGVVWAVNITGDGRLIVAAYSDGSIRWHRMADGVELLAFMPLANQKDWVAWTPEGFYDATPGAQGVLRWHVNHGWDAPATDVPVTDIPGSYRPNVLPLVLQQLETPRALGLAVLAEHNEEVRRRTNSHVPPGTRLHLLAVGVGTYQQDDHLHLKFADHDAESLASAIKTTQEPLYTVEARSLLNQDANKKGIMTTLASIGRHMEAGGGNDLAVVFFSGHGAMVGANKLYLLPYDADVREDARSAGLGDQRG